MRNGAYTFALLVMGLAVVWGLGSCGGGPGTVQGTVTEAKDPNQPAEDPANVGPALAQAEVVIFTLTKVQAAQETNVYQKGKELSRDVTDDQGAFRFSVKPGSYQVEVSVNGTRRATRLIEVESGKTVSLSINVPAEP